MNFKSFLLVSGTSFTVLKRKIPQKCQFSNNLSSILICNNVFTLLVDNPNTCLSHWTIVLSLTSQKVLGKVHYLRVGDEITGRRAKSVDAKRRGDKFLTTPEGGGGIFLTFPKGAKNFGFCQFFSKRS